MHRIIFIIALLPLLSSCFKEDQPVKPYGGEFFSVTESMYTHQSFFDLSTRLVTAVNPIEEWDLGFESSETGWHIKINSGKYLGIFTSGSVDFDGLVTVPQSALWRYDKSDGNLDSTAIGTWLSPFSVPKTYTGEVFVIGLYNGIKYVPFKKIIFISLIDQIYSFRFADMDGNNPGTFSITKDPLKNFVYFSFSQGGKSVIIEPEKNNWDFVFTQYSTTLYTDQGVPTPYFVRGVLSNRNGVEVALDTLIGFPNLSSQDIGSLQFDSKSDAIGHDWKSVTVEGSTSASYSIRPKNTYIIRSTEGFLYKLRFTGFFNDRGVPGYPRFEIKELL
jgi:hypothetical protein